MESVLFFFFFKRLHVHVQVCLFVLHQRMPPKERNGFHVVIFLIQAALTLLVDFQNNEIEIFLLLQDSASKLRESGLAASS